MPSLRDHADASLRALSPFSDREQRKQANSNTQFDHVISDVTMGHVRSILQDGDRRLVRHAVMLLSLS